MVSESGPLWYSTLRWKTSQTVLAHHYSNYQQQECPFHFYYIFLPFFLLHLSSPSPGLSSLPLAPSPLLTLDTFLLILPSQQSYLFFFFLHSPLHHTTLNDYHSQWRIAHCARPPDGLRPGNVPLNGTILDRGDDQTGEDLMIQLICRSRRLSLRHYNPQEDCTITFKLGVSNQKTGLIDFPLHCLHITSISSFYSLAFSLIILFFLSSFIPVTFYLMRQPSSSFPHFMSAKFSSSVLKLFYLTFIQSAVFFVFL